jgi:hypothetical protein
MRNLLTEYPVEVFLLLLDELDDAFAVLWTLLPRLLGVLSAGALLFATGFAFLRLPALAIPSAALLIGATLFRGRRNSLPDSPLRDH